MINLRSLIDLLPRWYREVDTYKDGVGKGLLERFLEICGDYFKDEISTGIDNILNLIDISSTHEMYINYFWEYFGMLPYAYGAIYKGSDKNKYDPEINQDMWDLDLDSIPRARYRDILRYAISLYKIRGTHDFYDILMGFYGMSITLIDPSDTGGSSPIRSQPLYDNGLFYDTPELTYDELIEGNCLACASVTITVTSPEILTTEQQNRILLILNRFRPVNVVEFDNTNVTFIT